MTHLPALRPISTAPAAPLAPRLEPVAWIAGVILVVWLLAPGVDRLAPLFGGSAPESVDIGALFQSVGGGADFLFGQSAFQLIAFAALFTVLGWWRLIQVEPSPLRPIALAVIPALTAFVLLGGAGVGFLANPDPSLALMAMQTVAMLAVATVEEFGWRGVAVVGLRGSRFPEWSVWLLTTSGFALMHLLNIFSGAEVGSTLFQVLYTFFLGTACYLARRAGGIWLAIAVHFGNNLLQVGAQASVESDWFELVNALALAGQILMLLSVPATIVLLVRESRRARRAGRTVAEGPTPR
ncbi:MULTISPECIES: CPBP family intramembrane glutamic endopeptidase [unclassified Microbacterium]|uniref:CPBP family intramembrane glutamic endopeptidase n=1 Tax=unclassified Microbacterium TaxID=2609290 RepID=UPI0034306CBC